MSATRRTLGLAIVLATSLASFGTATRAPGAPFEVLASLTISIAGVPPSSFFAEGEGTSEGSFAGLTLPEGVIQGRSDRQVLPVFRAGPDAIPPPGAPNFRGTDALMPLNRAFAGLPNGADTATITQFGKFATEATATTFAAAKLGSSGSCLPPSYTNCRVLYAAAPIVEVRFRDVGLAEVDFAPGKLTALQTGTYYRVAIAGDGVNGSASLEGAGLVGLFNENSAFPQYPPAALANIAVPLGFVGQGFGYEIALAAVNLTLTGAGWTTRTAAVIASPGSATRDGSRGFVVSTPFGGTTFVTRVTQMGFDGRSASGAGSIQFVTPISIRTNIAGFEQIPTFASLEIDFRTPLGGPDPDPGPGPMPGPGPGPDPGPGSGPGDPIPEPGSLVLFGAAALWVVKRALR